MTIFIKTANNHDTREESKKSALHCPEKTRTQQHQKEEADINTIVKRFGLTGQLPENVRMPRYGDFTEVTDYQTALNAVIAANNAFLSMPAHVRRRFNNDPAAFVDFCSDASNLEEAKKLGLVETPKEAAAEGQAAPVPQSPAPQA